jgi:hypothetical protein
MVAHVLNITINPPPSVLKQSESLDEWVNVSKDDCEPTQGKRT